MRMEDLTGQTFGNLTVVELSHHDTKMRTYFWRCRCQVSRDGQTCGGERIVKSGDLKQGKVKTCRACAQETIKTTRQRMARGEFLTY